MISHWNGDRVGQLVLANEPFADRVGHCYVDVATITLPNGVTLEGVSRTRVSDYLAVGTLAVAVQLTGDYFNDYVPLTLERDNDELTLNPMVDLRFGAYDYGHPVGQLSRAETEQIAAGLMVRSKGLFWATLTR